MSTGTLQSLITLGAFVIFLGIVGWAWSKGRRKAFDEAARIPLEDDRPPAGDRHRGAGAGDEVSKEQR